MRIEPFAELPPTLLHTISFVVGLTIVSFLHMVIGEMAPKNIAIADPEQDDPVAGPPVPRIHRWCSGRCCGC